VSLCMGSFYLVLLCLVSLCIVHLHLSIKPFTFKGENVIFPLAKFSGIIPAAHDNYRVTAELNLGQCVTIKNDLICVALPSGQCYETFYGRNLRIFATS
jgi:hypothetical protein